MNNYLLKQQQKGQNYIKFIINKKILITFGLETLIFGEVMPFSIGGHLAFNIPMNNEDTYDDYTLTIKPKKEVNHFESDPVP